MDKLFKLKQNNTTVRIEIVAGLTTFMTMAYIIALNPNLLTGFGANGGMRYSYLHVLLPVSVLSAWHFLQTSLLLWLQVWDLTASLQL